MKKKILLILSTVCLIISAAAFTACKGGGASGSGDSGSGGGSSATQKTDNTVTLAEVADIKCGELPVLNAVAEGNAEITFVYSTSEDGEYKSIPEEFTYGEYFVKAVAAETENYKQTTSAARKFAVKHKFSAWVEDRSEEYDYGVCVCDEIMEDVSFKKKVETVQEIVVTRISEIKRPTDGDNTYEYKEEYLGGKISLAELSGIKTTGEITLGEISLGTDINALDLSGLTDKKLHGEQNLAVEVTDENGYKHNAVVPVLLITREIKTDEELNVLLSGDGFRCSYKVNGKVITPVTEDGKNDLNYVSGYYKLAQDIVYTGKTSGIAFQEATFDGGNHKITAGSEESGAIDRGLFSEIYSSTIKNLVIDITYNNPVKTGLTKDSDFDYNTVFGNFVFGTEFENITINYVAGTDSTYCDTKGLLVNYDVGACEFKNFTINAGGKKLGAILCSSGVAIEQFKFENFVINDCTGIGCLITTGGEKIQPWQVSGIKGSVKNAEKSSVSFDPLSEDTVTVPLGAAYASLKDKVATVTKVSASDEKTDVTDSCNFTAEGFWCYHSDIVSATDSKQNIKLIIKYNSENFDVGLELEFYVLSTETHKVSFNQKSGAQSSVTVRDGEKLTFPEAEKAGEKERFLGWQAEDGKFYTADDAVFSDLNLTAVYDEFIANSLFEGAAAATGNAPAGYERLFSYIPADANALAFADVDLTGYNKVYFEFMLTNWAQINYPAEAVFYATTDGSTIKVEALRKDSLTWSVTFSGAKVIKDEKPATITLTRTGNKLGAFFAGLFGGSGIEFTTTEVRGIKGKFVEPEKKYEVVDSCAFGADSGVGASGFTAVSDKTAPSDFEKVYKRVQSGKWQTDLSHADISGYDELRFSLKVERGYLLSDTFEGNNRKDYASDDWLLFVITRTADGWNVKIVGTDFDYSRTVTDTRGICAILYHATGGWGLGFCDEGSYKGETAVEVTVYCTELIGVKKEV